jgi:hypothetical protein
VPHAQQEQDAQEPVTAQQFYDLPALHEGGLGEHGEEAVPPPAENEWPVWREEKPQSVIADLSTLEVEVQESQIDEGPDQAP